MTSALADTLEVENDPVPADLLRVCRKLQAAALHRCRYSEGERWEQVAVLLPRLMRDLRKEDMEGQRQISLDGFFVSKDRAKGPSSRDV